MNREARAIVMGMVDQLNVNCTCRKMGWVEGKFCIKLNINFRPNEDKTATGK